MNVTMRSSMPETAVVWDPFVRIGHWLLVIAFAAAYLTAEEESGSPDVLHVWGGYVVGTIVVLRILWGFVGPKHARFRDFVYSPATIFRNLVDVVLGSARRYFGHSPAGGAMVIALLACLTGTVATGMVAYGERGNGPLAEEQTTVLNAASGGEGEAERAAAQAEGSVGEESFVAELHGALANLTLALVILHVVGVAVASLAHRENLVAAMVSGKKRIDG
jgi:cytochrome b